MSRSPAAMTPEAPASEASASSEVLRGLDHAAEELEALGVRVPHREGKLLRPLFALALVPRDRWATLDTRFWTGALAVQMAHEASLLHDDVIDSASSRRGRPTVSEEHGVATAVVLGDQYLTGAYRAAARTASFEFMQRFSDAVERTVAGEVAQAQAAGRRLEPAEYDEVIEGKSGQLFGAAAALGATVAGLGQVEERHALGLALGNLYQRIDDLLDYCTLTPTGKPALQDYRQRKWSWVLDLAEVDGFDHTEAAVVDAIFGFKEGRTSPARLALEELRAGRRDLIRDAMRLGADPSTLERLLSSCVVAVEERVMQQEAAMVSERDGPTASTGAVTWPASAAECYVRQQAAKLEDPNEWQEYFGRHARTFRLAARLFPPREAALVTGLYAYCRFTDDLVDEPTDEPSVEKLTERLDAWRALSRAAFEGDETGVTLADTVLGTAAARGVAWEYPEALLDGVGMDLVPRRYQTWGELERYTFCVAGAVGGWMTQLFGLQQPDLLDRAHALGHAMQLTNIARDVGEDWRRERLYLPLELLEAHAVSTGHLNDMVDGLAPISEEYRAVVRALLDRADTHYESAWPGIRRLPPFFRRPVAAAAAAYRGIHREIRRSGYDNLTTRAHTSVARRILLAGTGLLQSRSSA